MGIKKNNGTVQILFIDGFLDFCQSLIDSLPKKKCGQKNQKRTDG
jgi:hypothetical protein